MTFTFELQKNYLLCLVAGQFEFGDSLKMIDALLDACEKHAATKALVDLRGLQGTIPAIERFHFAEAFSTKYFDRVRGQRLGHCRFGYLGNDPVVDPNRFGETVAINRGMTTKISTDLKEIMDWLLVEG